MEPLEDRLVPAGTPGTGAVRDIASFGQNAITSTLFRNDDGSSSAQNLGFSINFFGVTRSSAFVNNNGNITFDSALSTYTPFGLTSTNRQIIAPFFADVDTRNATLGGNSVKYGTGTLNGQKIFHSTWIDVGYYSNQVNKLNTFQVLLIERSDTGVGNFDIEFNYDQIQWETGQASGGVNGLGGSSARAGYANGTTSQGTFFEFTGSGTPGAFLDTNTVTGLANTSRNSNVQGRHVFFARSGTVVQNNPPQFTNLPSALEIKEGSTGTFDVNATDPENDPLTFSLINPPEFASINASTGLVTFTPPNGTTQAPISLRVQVQDTSGNFRQQILQLNVLNVAPSFEAGADETVDRGASLTDRTITFSDPGAETEWAITVEYDLQNDNTPGIVKTLRTSTKSFSLLHDDLKYTFAQDGVYQVKVTVNDGEVSTVDTFEVNVVPDASKVEVIKDEIIPPGQTTTITVPSGNETKAAIEFEQSANATQPASVQFALFNENPNPELPRLGEFFDVNVRGAAPDSRLVVRFNPNQAATLFEVGFLDESLTPPAWVSLGNFSLNPDGTLSLDLTALLQAGKLTNTVFSVSVAQTVSQTGSVAPATAQATTTSTTTTDVQPALSQSVSFISQTQLSVTVTGSQIRQLSPAGTTQSVTTTSTAPGASATSLSGGGEEKKEEKAGGVRPASWLPFSDEPGTIQDAGEKPAIPGNREKGAVEKVPMEKEAGEQAQPQPNEQEEESLLGAILLDEIEAELSAPAVDRIFSFAPLLAAVPAVGLLHQGKRRRRGTLN